MIVRDLQEAEKTERRVEDPNDNWDSVRLLLKDDNMGFSFHITTIYSEIFTKQARKDGFKVLFVGAGGDELFYGYNNNNDATLRYKK